MKLIRFIAWPVLGLLLWPAISHGSLVEPDIYLADMHYSEWEFTGSKAKCELRHEIPKFGISRFLRLAGEHLSFRIDSFQPVPEQVEGLLREISPSWEHNEPDPLTQEVQFRRGLSPVELSRKPSSWLISSLDKGQIGSFDFLDWDDTRKVVHVQLSPVKFQKPYRQFKRCLEELSNKGFSEYRETEVRFPLDVHQLDAAAERLLDELAEYIKADESIKRLSIEGHADDRGTHGYNRKLSERRARSVYDYLVAAGVDSALLKRRAFGEERPRVASRLESARAANRRAEIKLDR